MKNETYKILLTSEPEGKYTATVPALPGCITYGDNVDHAVFMAKEAIALYIEK
jgi:predicted RNase H-like HicB family nuclease